MTNRERLGQTVSKEWAASLFDYRGSHSTLPRIPAWQDMMAADREIFCRLAEAVLREHAASLPLPQELEEIRARRQKASPPPWSISAEVVATGRGTYRQEVRITSPNVPNKTYPNRHGIIAMLSTGESFEQYASLKPNDADFIAHAPDDIDRLLAYAAAQEAQGRAMRTALQSAMAAVWACHHMNGVRRGLAEEVETRVNAALAGPLGRTPTLRSLTPEEAQRAYDNAAPVPLSEERIQEIVDFATGRTPTPGRST